MNENRLPDYIDHIQQAVADVCSFVEGLAKNDFLTDKRTQRADDHESHHHRRGYHKGAVAQHAQSHGPRLFRHRSRCCVGDGTRMAARVAEATASRTSGCRQ